MQAGILVKKVAKKTNEFDPLGPAGINRTIRQYECTPWFIAESTSTTAEPLIAFSLTGIGSLCLGVQTARVAVPRATAHALIQHSS